MILALRAHEAANTRADRNLRQHSLIEMQRRTGVEERIHAHKYRVELYLQASTAARRWDAGLGEDLGRRQRLAANLQ